MEDNYCGEMVLRYIKKDYSKPIKINSSNIIVEYLSLMLDADEINTYEFAYLICLGRDNSLLGFSRISQGGRNITVIDPITVFTTALLKGSSAIILVHNHPSGNLVPSQMDKDITYKIKEGGKLLGVALNDHIIIDSQFNHYSFANEGIL